ncbi:hypothetical protein KR222_009457, partial [Zaprionus bogoriensis]
ATVNVITIITSSSGSNSNNNNNNNSNSINNNNNNNESRNNLSLIECESTLAPGGAGAQPVAGESVDHSFVAIPLLERRRRSRSHSRCHIAPLAPIICIPTHPEDLTQLSRSVSCFVRFRRSFAKFFAKIMGSNNPSEADRYDYYDCE